MMTDCFRFPPAGGVKVAPTSDRNTRPDRSYGARTPERATTENLSYSHTREARPVSERAAIPRQPMTGGYGQRPVSEKPFPSRQPTSDLPAGYGQRRPNPLQRMLSHSMAFANSSKQRPDT